MRSRLHPVVIVASLVAFVLMIPAGKVFAALVLNVPGAKTWTAAMAISASVVALGNLIFPPVFRFCVGSTGVTRFFSHYDAEKRVSVSHVEAMIAAGRYDDAAAELDLLLKMHGLDRGVCLLAVDLHLGKFGARERGEALLRRMRTEAPALWEGFATQRLIDLYMANADSHPKAMTELRRMIARFPGTPEALGAQKCLESLKQDHPVSTV